MLRLHCFRRVPVGRALTMITREKTLSIGKYLVSPLTRRTDSGHYAASVSIRSGSGSSTHDRIFRFVPQFPTRAGASQYATEQGLAWLQAAAMA